MKHSRLTWNDITVEQFLSIYKLSQTADLDDITRLERAVCILFDKTEKEVDEMTMAEFNRLSGQAAFVLTEQVPGKARRKIRANGKLYRINYSPSKLKHRQYVEVLHFGEKPVDNMHLIMASIVEPVTWYGKKLKNTADDHERIAADMLLAPVGQVYHSAVFFCSLYINLINSIRPYLENQLVTLKQAETMEQASEMITVLINAMAGFIPQKSLRILKV